MSRIPTQQAKARLAASNVVGSMNAQRAVSLTIDYQKALARMQGISNQQDVNRWQAMGGLDKGITLPEMLLGECITILQTAPITLNFEPYKWFGKSMKANKILSIWNVLQTKTPGYADTREDAENLMFGYNDEIQMVGQVNVGSDIAKLGGTGGMTNNKADNEEFVPDMRPKYAAINYSWARCGAAPDYGMSHFVLNDYVRFNGTFTHRDSFGVTSSAQVATYHNMYPVISNCADYVLKQIAASARNLVNGIPSVVVDRPVLYCDPGGDANKGSHYLEAILHTEIQFDRDIKAVRIKKTELNDKNTADATTLKRFTVKKSTMQGYLKKFLKKYHLEDKCEQFT